MSGAIKRQTTNFGLNIINYDFPRWHTFEWQNWDVLDAVLAAANLTSVRGVWANSTQYVIGDRVIDDTDNTIWLNAVNHTSAASGTFLADRTANPSYWSVISSLPVNRGNWVTGVGYSTQDIVREGNAYYFCVAAHTSGVFATDLAASRWALIFDLTDAINAEIAAEAAATAANASAVAADASADAAAISEANAATAGATAGAAAGAAQFDIKIPLTSIGLLSDVDITTDPPITGEGLVWNGTEYVPGPAGGGMFKGDNGTVGNRAGDIFRITEQQLDTNTTIAGTENAHAPGPMTIASGITLTISSGGNLVIT